MRYLDRHRLSLLARYARLATQAAEERAPHAEAISLFVRVAFDQASLHGRELFVELTKATPGAEWPWSAVIPIDVQLDSDDDLIRELTHVPPALVLLIARDTSEPELLDPGNWLGDGDWTALKSSVTRWTPETFEAFIDASGWRSPDELPFQPEPLPEPIDEPPPPDVEERSEQEPGEREAVELDRPAPDQHTTSPSPTPLWKTWEFWTAAGVVGLSAWGLTTALGHVRVRKTDS